MTSAVQCIYSVIKIIIMSVSVSHLGLGPMWRPGSGARKVSTIYYVSNLITYGSDPRNSNCARSMRLHVIRFGAKLLPYMDLTGNCSFDRQSTHWASYTREYSASKSNGLTIFPVELVL